jgi:streptogrisin C
MQFSRYGRFFAARAVLLVGLFLASAQASAQTRTGPIYSYLTSQPQMCLDVPRGDFRAGVLLQIYRCQNSPNQQFTYDERSGRLSIGGLCVDAYVGASGRPMQQGDRIGLWTCQASPNQQWVLSHCAPGKRCLQVLSPSVMVTLANRTMCMDLPNGQTAQGTPVNLWTCQGSPNQMFNVMNINR